MQSVFIDYFLTLWSFLQERSCLILVFDFLLFDSVLNLVNEPNKNKLILRLHYFDCIYYSGSNLSISLSTSKKFLLARNEDVPLNKELVYEL